MTYNKSKLDSTMRLCIVNKESAFSVSCVIVTYADRRNLLGEVLRRLAELVPRIESVVVVFNGVPYQPRLFIDELNLPLIIYVESLDTNMGSAGGYAKGLDAAATHTQSAYLWLLDDDNRPDIDALAKLESAWYLLGSDPATLLLSLRKDRWEYLSAVYKGEHMGFIDNAFYNFHLGQVIRRKLAGWSAFRGHTETHPNYPLVRIGYADYGGLLLHRGWTTRVAPPRGDYFVYGDDHEYTDRITRSGGHIYLCASSIVIDIDRSWFQARQLRCHYLLDPDAPVLRVYFGLRNRVASEVAHISSPPLYLLNALIFATRIVLGAYRYWFDPRFWSRLQLLAAAFREGRTGYLRPMNSALKQWISNYE